ncbi:MAG: hypothetical protein AAB683_02080 [Patescibacteria group bacterium]
MGKWFGKSRLIAIASHVADGSIMHEYWHVLIDHSSEDKLQIKKIAMTKLEASNRNENLRGTGYSWNMVG